jgi:peptidoglycan L-alanyl-D-glutamate endopeptidase CwlK
MSARLFADDVTFQQRFLKCCGFYKGRVDGKWGPKTDAAFSALTAQGALIAAVYGTFDTMSERAIRTLQPTAQRLAREFLKRVLAAKIPARIISGTRTYAEQDALYARGRNGDPSKPVTNAKGGQSNHNFGVAWDIGIFARGTYRSASLLYAKAAKVGLAPGIEWGGHWIRFPDQPHYQLATGIELASVRDNFESGTAFV